MRRRTWITVIGNTAGGVGLLWLILLIGAPLLADYILSYVLPLFYVRYLALALAILGCASPKFRSGRKMACFPDAEIILGQVSDREKELRRLRIAIETVLNAPMGRNEHNSPIISFQLCWDFESEF